MKKRSLVVAIAMLIVSALVLTTATYAWFASGTTLSVATISADVATQTGGLWLSVDNTNWKTTITEADIAGVNSNVIPSDTMVPVSYKAGGTMFSGALSLNSTTGLYDFAAGAQPNDGYVYYQLYIKSDTDRTVSIAPTLTSTYQFICAAVNGPAAYGANNAFGGSTDVIANGVYAYEPIGAANTAGVDSNSDGIIADSEKTAGTILTGTNGVTTVSGTDSISLSLAAGVSQSITVYMWAEGQHSACTGSIQGATDACSIALTITDTTT